LRIRADQAIWIHSASSLNDFTTSSQPKRWGDVKERSAP